VVIPTYNGRGLLATCLASLRAHRPPEIDLEVIVADDGSTDGTAAWLAAEHPEARLVRLDRNGGFVAAANAGIAAARGSVIQLLNNDAEVTAGWAAPALRHFDDPAVGSVAPLVLVRRDPSRVDSAGDRYALIGWPSKRGHGEPAADWSGRDPGPVFGASGSSAFYRAEALRRCGAYDPRFGSYYEDVDLAFRLRWGGYRCVFEPRSVVLHDISASYDHARPDLQRRMARNAELVFWSNLPAGRLALAIVPHLGFVALQMVARLARRRLRPFLLGKLDAARAAGAIRLGRSLRRDLARSAVARPHFPITAWPAADLRNHLAWPAEARRPTASATR